MHRKTFLYLFGGLSIGVGAGIALVFGLGLGRGGIGATASLAASPEKGASAPDFSAEDLKGNQLALRDLRGRVVLVNFWATWCAPCRFEMPALQSRFEQYAPDLAVVAVDFDEPKDLVQDFVDELGLTFDVVLDPGGKIQDLYRIRGYPSSMFVDREGVIQIVHIGIMTEDQLDGYLQEMGVIE